MTTREKVRHELVVWSQYLIISLIAAGIAHFAFETAQQGLGSVGDPNSDVAINTRELLLKLWREYYRWWLSTFIILSAIRFLFLFVSGRLTSNPKLK